MDMQEAFDKIIAHQRSQGAPCTDASGFPSYRQGDMRCAIGCMLTEEECELYDTDEDTSVVSLYFHDAEPKSLHLQGVDKFSEENFWEVMQHTHDARCHFEPARWLADCEREWQSIAAEYDLKYPVVITERMPLL